MNRMGRRPAGISCCGCFRPPLAAMLQHRASSQQRPPPRPTHIARDAGAVAFARSCRFRRCRRRRARPFDVAVGVLQPRLTMMFSTSRQAASVPSGGVGNQNGTFKMRASVCAKASCEPWGQRAGCSTSGSLPRRPSRAAFHALVVVVHDGQIFFGAPWPMMYWSDRSDLGTAWE